MSAPPRFRIPGLQGVCAAVLPPEAGGPDSDTLARRLEEYVAAFPAPSGP